MIGAYGFPGIVNSTVAQAFVAVVLERIALFILVKQQQVQLEDTRMQQGVLLCDATNSK